MGHVEVVLTYEEFDSQATPVQSEMQSQFTKPGIALFRKKLWSLRHDFERGEVTLSPATADNLLPKTLEKYRHLL